MHEQPIASNCSFRRVTISWKLAQWQVAIGLFSWKDRLAAKVRRGCKLVRLTTMQRIFLS